MRKFAAVTCVFGLALAGLSANAQQVTLRREGRQVYLISGGSRLLIKNPGAMLDPLDNAFRLPDGAAVSFEGNGVRVKPKDGPASVISLSETLKQWLPDDSKWNGHAFENYIRGVYNHEGLTVSLGDGVLFQGALLAIMTTNSLGGSGNVIKSQQLVRVQTSPTPALQMLRLLDVPNIVPYHQPRSIPRLFVQGQHLLLFEHPGDYDEMQALTVDANPPMSDWLEIDLNGKIIRAAGAFPYPLYPIGFAGSRWLALGLFDNTILEQKYPRPPVWILDTVRHNYTPLPGNWKTYYGPDAILLPEPGSDTPYLALQPEPNANQAGKVAVIHLPDGKRTAAISTPHSPGWILLWHNLIVVVEPSLNRITVYKAQNGRRVKTFALQAGRKAEK